MVAISGRLALIFLGTFTAASARHRKLLTFTTENMKLVLTPTHVELTDAAKQSFVTLFDEAMVRYIGLQQSLSRHEGLEYHVDSVDTAITSQLVESTFLLGSDAGSTTRGRRQLLEGVTTGSIVSSLNMQLSSSASLVVAADDNADAELPDLKEYAIGFFAGDGAMASSFVDAARHIQDEYGRLPLSGLQVIGVGENAMYGGPYSYLGSDAPAPANEPTTFTFDAEAKNNADSDREIVRGSIIAGVTSPDIGTEPTQANEERSDSVHWMWVLITAGGVALVAFVGLFIAVAVRRRKKTQVRENEVEVEKQRNISPNMQQKQPNAVPLSVLNCNYSFPSASPMSFDGPRSGAGRLNGSKYASNSASHENNGSGYAKGLEEQNQLEDRRPEPLVTNGDNEVTTPRSTWAEPFLSFARSAGLSGMVQPKESTDEDSKGNEIPKLSLPPREFRKNFLSQQKESTCVSTRSRSAVEELIGNVGSGKKGRSTPKEERHTLHTNRGEDLYVIPEDDASL